jgi:predicted TIM-barrel fold metal-dependent hydrolase
MNDPAWRRGLAHVAEHGLVFEIQLFAGQMRNDAALARAFPDVTLSIPACSKTCRKRAGRAGAALRLV